VALYAANVASTMGDGVAMARDALANGRARAKLSEFVSATQALAAV
jgi:anthranilate phosphoribosyltransferase